MALWIKKWVACGDSREYGCPPGYTVNIKKDTQEFSVKTEMLSIKSCQCLMFTTVKKIISISNIKITLSLWPRCSYIEAQTQEHNNYVCCFLLHFHLPSMTLKFPCACVWTLDCFLRSFHLKLPLTFSSYVSNSSTFLFFSLKITIIIFIHYVYILWRKGLKQKVAGTTIKYFTEKYRYNQYR